MVEEEAESVFWCRLLVCRGNFLTVKTHIHAWKLCCCMKTPPWRTQVDWSSPVSQKEFYFMFSLFFLSCCTDELWSSQQSWNQISLNQRHQLDSHFNTPAEKYLKHFFTWTTCSFKKPFFQNFSHFTWKQPPWLHGTVSAGQLDSVILNYKNQQSRSDTKPFTAARICLFSVCYHMKLLLQVTFTDSWISGLFDLLMQTWTSISHWLRYLAVGSHWQ